MASGDLTTAGVLAAAGLEPAAALACGRIRSAGLRLARPSHGVPLGVIIVSLGRSAAGSEADRPAAIVFIADVERTHVTPERLLRDPYDLIPAGMRLAMSPASGRSLTSAAAQVAISRYTAHTQLGSIFAKTGTANQTELVRLIHRGPAAIRPWEDSADLQPPVEPGPRGEKTVRHSRPRSGQSSAAGGRGERLPLRPLTLAYTPAAPTPEGGVSYT